MPSEAVVVRAPEQHPRTIASSNLNRYFPTYIAKIRGTVVANTPHRNRLKPSCCRPATKPGPEEMPTTAMKTLSPTEFMNHTVDEGIRPKVGRTERSQPNTRPEISAPPAVERVSGTPLTCSTTAPINAPRVIAPAMKATSATSLGRSGTPNSLTPASV